MNKKNNKKGFTLAELLIVVAIIAVLVAIAIPIFTKQLEKSREATDISNVRSATAEVVATYLADQPSTATTAKVPARQKEASWQGPKGTVVIQVEGVENVKSFTAKTSGSYEITMTPSGTLTIG